jgi:hypothetical protein
MKEKHETPVFMPINEWHIDLEPDLIRKDWSE